MYTKPHKIDLKNKFNVKIDSFYAVDSRNHSILWKNELHPNLVQVKPKLKIDETLGPYMVSSDSNLMQLFKEGELLMFNTLPKQFNIQTASVV